MERSESIGMRIAFLTSEFITEPNSFDGGLSNYIYKVALELIKYGHYPIVIVSSTENNKITYNGIEVHRVLPQPTTLYKLVDKISRYKWQQTLDILLQSYVVNQRLKQLHSSSPIDVVQYPSYQAIGIFTPHYLISTMRISGYQKLADPANGHYSRSFRERQGQILEHFSYLKAKNIFGPSHFLANIISKKYKKPVRVIETPFLNSSIDEDKSIINEVYDIIGDSKYGLYFGRLAQIKGLLEIVAILDDFFNAFPNHYFVIIGKDVGCNNKPSLELIYQNINPSNHNRLIYRKEQPHQKLMPIISKANFVLMPSRIENFPNACVEAMALNKIVIATKGVSFEQLIEDKVNGFLFEKANSADLLKVIKEVLNLHSEQKSQIETNAGKSIERLNPNITIRQLIDYYQSLLKS